MTNEQTSNPDVEVAARKDGWAPKDKWNGPEDQWVDAQTFVERGQQINPILRANNERLKKELAATTAKHEADIAEMRTSVDEFKLFQKENHARKIADYEREIKVLRAAKSEATEQRDHERAAEIEEQIDEVKDKVATAKEDLDKKPEVKKIIPDPTPIDDTLQSWLDSNPWYGDADQYLEETELVTGLAKAIKKKYPDLTGKSFLEKLNEKIEERLPDIRQSTKKGPSVASAGLSANGGRKAKKSYDNLPKEAKDACDRFVKQKLMTAEQYVADYDWE